MTDRINALTVVLEQDIRDDDVQGLVDAIGWLRGVLRVDLHVASTADHVAKSRARADIRDRLYKALEDGGP